MNLIDIVIILLFLTGLMRGIEIGIVRQTCTTIGLLVGLALGIFVEGKLVGLTHTPNAKAMLALLVISALGGFFIGIGGSIGERIRGRIERAKRLKLLDVLDRGLGGLVASLTILVAVWLAGSLFSNVPLRDLQHQVRSSAIIAQLDRTLPPVPDAVTKLGRLINPNSFPDVFTGLEPRINTNAPLPSIGVLDQAVKNDRDSVVKVEGAGCGGISQGSGFVAADNLVVTNAHVVAGVKHPYVIDGNGQHATTVIAFDPNLDIAILRTSRLAGQPLTIATAIAADGTPGVVLGFPGGGDFSPHPAIILDAFKAVGHNIYGQGETQREVYSVKATVRPGNSGGPLVGKNGQVIGVVFAESTAYDNIGYALTADQIQTAVSQAKAQTAAMATGSCTE